MKMRIYLLLFVNVIGCLLFFSSCKKDDSIKSGMTLKVGNKSIVFNEMKGLFSPSIGGNNSAFLTFSIQTSDNKNKIQTTIFNARDTFMLGTYQLLSVAGPLNNNIRDLYLTIWDEAVNKNLVYFSALDDFRITIDAFDSKSKKIKGSFFGRMNGGYPNPGGFGNTAYYDIRTDVVQGNFDMIYTPF